MLKNLRDHDINYNTYKYLTKLLNGNKISMNWKTGFINFEEEISQWQIFYFV